MGETIVRIYVYICTYTSPVEWRRGVSYELDGAQFSARSLATWRRARSDAAGKRVAPAVESRINDDANGAAQTAV